MLVVSCIGGSYVSRYCEVTSPTQLCENKLIWAIEYQALGQQTFCVPSEEAGKCSYSFSIASCKPAISMSNSTVSPAFCLSPNESHALLISCDRQTPHGDRFCTARRSESVTERRATLSASGRNDRFLAPRSLRRWTGSCVVEGRISEDARVIRNALAAPAAVATKAAKNTNFLDLSRIKSLLCVDLNSL